MIDKMENGFFASIFHVYGILDIRVDLKFVCRSSTKYNFCLNINNKLSIWHLLPGLEGSLYFK